MLTLTQLLVPLPPTSEEPGYSVAYIIHIRNLDNDTLLQIFSHYRLEDEDNWNLRLTWRKLAHVCRRWRLLMFDSSSHLDMRLHIANNSPSLDTLSHLPPLPLIIDYLDGTRTMTRKDVGNIQLGLRQHGQRVRQVTLRAPSSSFHVWLEPMNEHFPRLEDLSLSCTTADDLSLVLPEKFQAPGLRRLALHGIGLPKGFPLLTFTIALSTLSLTHIEASCYLPPGHLITQIQGLPHLEELTFGFAIPIPFPSSDGAPITPVTLPTLRRLTFRGVGAYLDNFVAQINTPLLERLSLTLFFELAVNLVNLTKFIQRTEGLRCFVSRVILTKDGASIYAGHYEQQGIGRLNLHVNSRPRALDWQIDLVILVCHALGDVLSIMKKLTLDADEDGMPSDWENILDSMLWHGLLLPFVGVKWLHIGSSLALTLAQALGSGAGGLALLALQELEVSLKIDLAQEAFSSFIKTRESMARPVYLSAPPHADGKVLVPPSVTSSGVHSVARSVSVPRGQSSPHAVARSLLSLHEMVREMEQRLEEERLTRERLEMERLDREHLEQLAIKQDHIGQSHLLWERIMSMRTDLERERLVLASFLREYSAWVVWERLFQVHLGQEQTEQEHLEWMRLEKACLERAHLKRARLEWTRARLVQACLVSVRSVPVRLLPAGSVQAGSVQARLVANRVHTQRARPLPLGPLR